MKYLLLVCNDGLPASDAEEALVGETIGDHIEAIADINLFGHPLQNPSTARTVRVRDEELLVADGPFVETKEHIAGFCLLECETREQAIAAAATHPLAWFNMLEVRPLAADADALLTPEALQRLEQGPEAGKQRFMLMICSDGVATEAKAEAMRRELPRWLEEMKVTGSLVAGARLEGPSSACLVRVRGPHTLVSEGPFAETKEFIAGFDVIDCSGPEEAVAIAAKHPVAWFHTIEVRPFTPRMCNEPDPQEEAQGAVVQPSV